MKPAPPVTRTCLGMGGAHDNMREMILVTGAAGFIGYHVARRLLERGDDVIGIDNLNPYYDPSLKEARLLQLRDFDRFKFVLLDVANRAEMAGLFREQRPRRVVHLA